MTINTLFARPNFKTNYYLNSSLTSNWTTDNIDTTEEGRNLRNVWRENEKECQGEITDEQHNHPTKKYKCSIYWRVR